MNNSVDEMYDEKWRKVIEDVEILKHRYDRVHRDYHFERKENKRLRKILKENGIEV